MIDKLRAMAVFAAVVDQGSFRAAARHLGLAPSRISETVSDLEKGLGVTLLYRSTRQMSLTQEGRVLYDATQAMLNEAETGLDAISLQAADPQGALRITAPAFLTQTPLVNVFAGFAARYPKIALAFDFSDTPRNLIGDGYDVSIRAGWLVDSDLMARSIGQADRLLVAATDYAKARPVPQSPQDLEAWDWVRFSVRPDQTELTGPDGQVETVLGRSSLSVNTAEALYAFALRGLGVTAIPEQLARAGIAAGKLVRLLPDWRLRPLGLYAVWPDQSRRQSITLLFVRYLADQATCQAESPA